MDMSKIRQRTEARELRMSEPYVLTKSEVLNKGYTYLGSLETAVAQGYYTIRVCENLKAPVTQDELSHITYYAMFKDCYIDNCILENSKRVRPCLPVFYRNKEQIQKDESVSLALMFACNFIDDILSECPACFFDLSWCRCKDTKKCMVEKDSNGCWEKYFREMANQMNNNDSIKNLP